MLEQFRNTRFIQRCHHDNRQPLIITGFTWEETVTAMATVCKLIGVPLQLFVQISFYQAEGKLGTATNTHTSPMGKDKFQ